MLAVDVGGTFTDAVVITAAGEIFSGKQPTTVHDQSLGVMSAALEALDAASVEPSQVDSFVHGMTVTTNALLEGRFAKTAMLATRGFTDVEELGRQNRPSLYRLCEGRPAPIVAEQLRFPIVERCGPEGVIVPLDESSVRKALASCRAAGIESIAVCLLFSFAHPEHELRIGELASAILPGVHVSLSHAVVGTFREYERFSTTLVDAALSPLLSGYLERLTARAIDAGLPPPDVMLSNGGSATAALAARNAAATVLSGPAGGAIGAARVAARHGASRALGFDMGGTSTDVSVVADGAVRITATRTVASRPVSLPSIDILTVGAGGGSIAWRDEGGALRVGPRSAGARPGPACYGHGGEDPTVTDANLVLGRLGHESALAGGLRLDRAAAERAIGKLAAQLGLGLLETAAGIVRIANIEMLRATSSATVARGVDPRDHALVAFGGAGPMHAADIAAALGISEILCPRDCGVLSAYGMAVSGRRRDRSRSVVAPLERFGDEHIAALVDELRTLAVSDLGDPADTTTEVTYELRHKGQAFELAVIRAATPARATELADAFHAEHTRAYGYTDREAPLELVTIRVSVATPGRAAIAASVASTRQAAETRQVWFDGRMRETAVVTGIEPGEQLAGPAVIELAQSTIVVPPGWKAGGAEADVLLTRCIDREVRP